MNASRLLVALLLTAPASAWAHVISIRVQQGGRVITHDVKLDAGGQKNFVGTSDGQKVIVNGMLASLKDGALLFQYQLEVSRPDGDRGFQAQGSVELIPGARVRAVECGAIVDLALDAVKSAKAPPAFSPRGPNLRLTATVGTRRCRLLQTAESQSNLVETSDGGRRKFILNAILARAQGDTCGLQYQIEDSPRQYHGEATLVLGKRASVDGAGFLLEGTAAPSAAAPAAAAAPSNAGPESSGTPVLLR